MIKALECQTRRDLAATAKSHGIAGWHGMRKQELVKAIAKIKTAKSKPKQKSTAVTKKNSPLCSPPILLRFLHFQRKTALLI